MFISGEFEAWQDVAACTMCDFVLFQAYVDPTTDPQLDCDGPHQIKDQLKIDHQWIMYTDRAVGQSLGDSSYNYI